MYFPPTSYSCFYFFLVLQPGNPFPKAGILLCGFLQESYVFPPHGLLLVLFCFPVVVDVARQTLAPRYVFPPD